jgi:uncharacterized caspase-like protein
MPECFRVARAGLLLCALAMAPGYAQQSAASRGTPAKEPRVALVIGNSAYASSPLRNPVNDARAIAKSLKEMGFEVTLKENATQSAMRQAIRSFGDQLARGGVGLFYFAGHGMQVKGRNFLIPTNADIDAEDEIEDQAVDGNLVLAKMESARNRLNIMILDACRNNPFARKFRSAASGLAQMDAPSGTLIAFATAPGSVASDGTGSNGLYTEHLLKHMATPGLPVEQLFKRVRIDVTRDTKDKQIPWESSSLKGDFFFNERSAAGSAAASQAVDEQAVAAERSAAQQAMEKAIKTALERQAAQYEQELKARLQTGQQGAASATDAAEISFWDTIKASTSPADFQAYLAQYPQGKFVALARLRVRQDKPAPQPEPPNKQSAPSSKAPIVQVASIAPTSLAAAKPGPMPNAGDTWTYQLSNRWNDKKLQVVAEVKAVTEDMVILDEVAVEGIKGKDEWAHTRGATLTGNSSNVPMFSPYLLALGGLNEKTELPSISTANMSICTSGNFPCRFSGKAQGRERITVPAGSFDTIRVELDGNYPARTNNMALALRVKFTIWYSAETKRVVKQIHEAYNISGSPTDTDVLELKSFKLN